MSKRFDKDPIMDQLKIMVTAYCTKAMANELNKSYSTLSNELREVDWAKMGFRDALSAIEIALADDAPEQARTAGGIILDMIARAFNRYTYPIPEINPAQKPSTTMRRTAKLSEDFGGVVRGIANALDDGLLELHEVSEVLENVDQLIRTALEMRASLKHIEGVIR